MRTAIGRQQLGMGALLDDPAGVQHDDTVGVLHGGQAVRDDQRGATAHQAFQRGLNLTLGLVVQGRGGLVQDQDGRVLDQGARDRQALALAAGQARGVLAHLGLQAVGQALDEFQQVGGGERVADLLLARLAQRAVADVGGDGVVEQHHVLADQRQMRAQAAQRQVVDGHVVDQDGSGLGQHEARQHVHQRGLAAARAAHQRHGLAGLDGEGHVVQRVAVGVGEAMADASEFHAAAHRLGQRARALVDFRLLVDQREHAFGGHQHLLHAGGDVGQALDGIENLRQGGRERGEAAHGQGNRYWPG